MSLLPFDLLSVRSLSVILVLLILLVTMAGNGSGSSTLVRSDSRYVNCYGTAAKDSFRCPNGSRNAIAGGNLAVGSSF